MEESGYVMVRGHAGPFEHHLREAIALNQERAPYYAALSSGGSRSISRALIAAEYMLLPVARWFDRQAVPYHEAGIPLLETLFVSMSAAPELGTGEFDRDDGTGESSVRPGAIRRRVGRAYRMGGFEGAASATAEEVAALDRAPRGDYLVRHLLESAHRVATLAPDHVTRAREAGLPSPAPLLGRLLRMHLWGLGPAAVLDRRARPLQLRGVAILAQDLPPIPVQSGGPRITMDDEAGIVAKVIHDVQVTLGVGHEDLIRGEAAQRRHFFNEPDTIEMDANAYREKVAEEVQQYFHDCFVDTTWPECPFHHRHPLWLNRGTWVCGQLDAPVAALGELRASRDASGRYIIIADQDSTPAGSHDHPRA